MLHLAFVLLVAASSLLFAGQSQIAGSASATVPVYSQSLPWRGEYMIHDWPASPESGQRAFRPDFIGLDCYHSAGTRIVCQVPTDVGAPSYNLVLADFPSKRLSIRFQRDPVAKTHLFEAWDEAGNRKFRAAGAFTSSNAITTGSADWSTGPTKQYLAYARVHSTLVPENSRPPVTYDPANIVAWWKLDGDLTDSGPNGYHASGTGTSYGTTPDQGTYPIPRANATAWSDWTSLRAGKPNTLSGASSYAQADLSADVTCRWAVISVPKDAPAPKLSSATQCEPIVTGLVFGTYVFALTVTGVNGTSASRNLQVGAVATDDNGVVIYADPAASTLLGDAIAFGKNPWGLYDYAHLRGVTLRSAYYDTISPPSWATKRPGKVSYNASVVGSRGTLNGGITATSSTITLNAGHTVDLSTMPTVIAIGGIPGQGGEEVLVTSAAGNVLTVAFDGRGWVGSTARSWGNGTAVFQNKATGTGGTTFLSDFCPAGVGPEGQIVYAVGTLSATAGSTTVTGAGGATWSNGDGGTGVYPAQWIRIQGTYSGGLPFIFVSPIASLNSTTSITLSRAYPAGADTASGLTYQIIAPSQRFFSPLWTRPDSTTGQAVYYGQGTCASDSALYFSSGYEVYTGTQTAQDYSYMSGYWMTSGGNGTPNFYDEVLANYALYYRSGYEPARDAARKLADYWLKQPLIDEGWTGSFPRNMSIAGAVVNEVLDRKTGSNWYALRRLANSGVSATTGTCNDDVRENAYQLMWLAFAALYDPLDTGSTTTPGQRSYWKAKLADAYARDNNCKGSDFGFASGNLFNPSPAVTLVQGSMNVDGSGFSSGTCNDTASGTGTISNGGSVLTISTGTPVAGGKILITGTKSGQPYWAYFQFSGTGPVQLSATWTGASGSVTWQTESDDYISVFLDGTVSAANPGKMYGCRYVSPTRVALNSPWTATSTNDGHFSRYNLTGWGSQVFINGIKVWQMDLASKATTGATSTGYAALTQGLSSWITTKGFDPITGGLYYGVGYPMCGDVPGTPAGSGFTWSIMNCQHGNQSYNIQESRALLSEAQRATSALYRAQPTTTNRDLGDQYYGDQWGSATYTAPGYSTDGGIPNIYASDALLNQGKWYGFQMGVGGGHQWPAVRLGGAAASQFRTYAFAVSLGGASSFAVRAIRPNGATAVSSACATGQGQCLDLDLTQGEHQICFEKRDSGGASIGGCGKADYFPFAP